MTTLAGIVLAVFATLALAATFVVWFWAVQAAAAPVAQPDEKANGGAA